ncbi:MAG TPA: aminomethyl-transferring glycine dehydrogenase [Candidatus Stackebrandtia excrementipullorum]|nr:aminomethyl-transferring glycine dehydrogenase [Candidatus Stackebrandtia excrementipullorum]
MNAQQESVIPFVRRHIGPDHAEQRRMLEEVGYSAVGELLEAAIPESIRLQRPLELPTPMSEEAATAELRALASANRQMRQMIGMGYYGTHTPAVIRRNVLENPAWYTAYTPYQPEISQGRLEALLNFQTMVSDLTGLDTAGASLLDEATAAAEAMTLTRRAGRSKSNVFVVDSDTLPQTLAVLRTRAEPLGIKLHLLDVTAPQLPEEFFGMLLSNPASSGALRDHTDLIVRAHEAGAMVAVACDLLSLTMVKSPGAMGADVAVGSAQRFGVPMGFGGPHAGFMSVRKGLERSLPGRLVGVSRDATGRPAYRLALQTREQHIRRERATSNICTAQVLLAVMASCYAVYHGPQGLRGIAAKVHSKAVRLAAGLTAGDVDVVHQAFFDTVVARVPGRAQGVVAAAAGLGVNLRLIDADHVGVACDETTSDSDLLAVWRAFRVRSSSSSSSRSAVPAGLVRHDDFMTHPVFSRHHSETSMLRYLRSLSDSDFALDRGMIPLGSCTMKLNAASQMEPISWPEFAHIHPYAPADQTRGYAKLIGDLAAWLAEVTGYDAVSLQPNAGSQGELAGLLAIRAYLESRGEIRREVCLIPSSAHGTNAASAVMAGMRVVVVACDDEGNIDMNDLDDKLTEHGSELAAIMVTYPSTHGVYEADIARLCQKVHDAGGQVYVDGANLNALLGFAKPGEFGADVSHLNLHKTFCIPHGGGGPGVGPVAVRSHLAEFLPGDHRTDSPVGPVSAAPYGSAGILPIPWMYLRMMGAKGLTEATGQAVLAANYVASRLADHYPVLYSGNKGLVAHECILDLRAMTKASGVTVDDVAKRLIDYGFHAPTMSFPVAGTLMVEPTESEDLAELDRFCDAMIAIKDEIDKVVSGEWPSGDNPLKSAPHTAEAVTRDEWEHPYTRAEAAYPAGVGRDKYWPPVSRIDGAYGDRNLACSCPPLEAFAS